MKKTLRISLSLPNDKMVKFLRNHAKLSKRTVAYVIRDLIEQRMGIDA